MGEHRVVQRYNVIYMRLVHHNFVSQIDILTPQSVEIGHYDACGSEFREA